MMKKEIELKLFGLPHEGNGDVRADVFVKKIETLLKALRAADQNENGKKTLEYLLNDLRHSSAYVSMAEFQYNAKRVPNVSAIQAFHDVAQSVRDGKGIPAGTHRAVAKAIADIGNGSTKSFSHGEIGIKGEAESVVRFDQQFDRRADRAFKVFESDQTVINLFEGAAFSTYKGKLKVIDLRGTVTSATLILSINGVELSCTANSVTVDNLKDALDKEVNVSGIAFFNGKDRLPEHIEIKKIEILSGNSDALRKWAGAFELPYPSAEDDW